MMGNFTGRLTRLLGIALMSGLVGAGVSAETFVSFNGKFHFSYPDSWVQVDYQTAEYYLNRGDAENEVDFEAVFSERQTFVIFQGQYLILTVDTVGNMTPAKIDSVLAELSAEFDRPVKEVDPESFMTGSLRDSIAFDRANSLVAVESGVAGGDAGPRVNLLVMKFYEQGIANYYFYAPSVEFAPSLPIYRSMVTSFSTEPPDDSLREDVRVADLEESESNSGRMVAMFAGLAMILIVIIAARIRSRARK